MKRTLRLFLTYVVPLILVGLLIGMVVFSTLLQTKRSVEYDYLDDVQSVSMNDKTIRVAGDMDYAPFSYIDTDGKPCGHDVELIYAIAREEGYNIELTMLPWHEAINGLAEGKYDVLLSADYTANRNNSLFSSPICSDPYTIFGKKGATLPNNYAELKNAKIASLEGGSATDVYIEPLNIQGSITYFPTLTDAFKAVDRGEMDFVIGSNLSGRHIISTNNLNMEPLASNIYENSMCFMVSENNEELLRTINKSIVIFQSNGVMIELYYKWFENYQPDLTFISLISQNRTLFIMITAILILVLYTASFMINQFSKQKEKRLSETSSVTGLPNLGAFRRIAEETIAADPDEEYMVVRIDIDHFKLYNDIYGTATGDKLLYRIGQEAKQLIRQTKHEVVLGHATADHFVLLMKASDFSPIRLYNMCVKMLSEIDPNYNFAVRIGYCRVDSPNVDIAIYCDWAYLALKSIKGDYVKHWAEYDKSMREQILEEREIADEMTEALERGQFVPYFQPQYNFQTKKLSGIEVLARWNHPENGMISPGKFIPVFEKNGFIYELDKYIWRQACIFLKNAKETGLDIPCLSVNISRRDIYRDDLLATLNSLVREYGIDKKKLHLEITESAYSENPELLINVVTELGKTGFIVEMDDFGSGYSSLSILKDLPFDVVKLDMVFLNESDAIGKTGNIISSIVHMAHQINLSVIAEGVETVEQAKFLHSIGCYYMQGYLFAKPMSEKDLISYLNQTSVEENNETRSISVTNSSVDFLDDRTQASLLFNSFIGSACILELQGSHINILRVNERFFEELGMEDRADFDILTDISSRIDPEYLEKFDTLAREAINTGNEVKGEFYIRSVFDDSPQGVWIFLRARFLGKKVDSYLFFCSVENITGRRALEKNNEDLLRELDNVVSNLPGGIARIRYDDKVNFEYMSQGFAQLSGRTVDELYSGLNENPLLYIHTDDVKHVSSLIEKQLSYPGEFDDTFRIIKKDGSTFWMNTRGLTEKNGDSFITYLYCADVSEEKEIEKKLKSKEITLSNIMTSVSGGTATIEFDGTRFKLLDVSKGIAKVMDKTTDEFRDAVENNIESLLYEQDFEKVFNSVVVGATTGKASDITFRVKKENEEPLWLRMHCTYEKTEDGKVIAQCIFRDISSVSDLYQNVINETETGIIVIDNNTHETIFANRAGAAIFEMTPEKLLGKQCYEYCWGKDVHCSLWTDSLPKEGLVIEDEYKGRHYHVRRKAISWNGIDAIITYYTDKTDNYSVEKQLEDLISNIPCGVTIIENTGDMLERKYINDVGKSILELNDTDRVISTNPKDDRLNIHSDDFNLYIKALNRAASENEPFSVEVRVIMPNESVKWIEINGQPFYSKEEQKQYIFSTFTDISTRKKSEHEAIVREAEYIAATNQSIKMICRYMPKNRSLSVTNEVADKFDAVSYLENAPEELARQGFVADESKEAWFNMFDSIDRGMLSGGAEELCIATLSTREFKWYRASFKAIQVEIGRTDVAVLSFEDITEKREKEKNKLVAYKAVLKALSTIYQVSLACDTTENKFRLLDNDKYILKSFRSTGSYDDMIRSATKYIPDEHHRALFVDTFSSQAINAAWEKGKEKVSIEHKQLDDSGNVHWMETSAIRVNDPNDKNYLHILVSQVIDKRKERELAISKELEESNAQLNIRNQILFAADNISEAKSTICIYDIASRTMTVPAWYAEKYNMSTTIKNYPNVDEKKFVDRFLNQNEVNKFTKIFDDIHKGISSNGIVVGFQNEGEVIWESVRTAIIRTDDGELSKAVIAIEDVTDRHNENITAQKEYKRMQMVLSNASSMDIEIIGTVNLASGMYTQISNANRDDDSQIETVDYDEAVRDYCNNNIAAREQKDFLNNLLLNSVVKQMKMADSIKYQFSTYDGRKEIQIKWCDSAKQELLVTIRDIQDRYLKELQTSAQDFIRKQIILLGAERNLDEGIKRLIESLGKYTASDRAYLIQLEDTNVGTNYEWCNKNVPKNADALLNEIVKRQKNVKRLFQTDSSVFVNDIENIKKEWPSEYDFLRKRKIFSLILFPIRANNQVIAFIGLDNPENRQSESINNILFLLGRLLGEKITAEKQKDDFAEQSKMQSQTTNTIISALSIMNYATWVIDMDTNVLNPINDATYSDVFGEMDDVFGNARNSINKLVEDYVPKEEKEKVLKFFDFDRIRKYLKTHDSDSTEYNGKNSGWTRIQIIPSQEGQEDILSRIIVTFSKISDEKRKEAEADERLKEVIIKLRQADIDKKKDYLTQLYNRYMLEEDASENGSEISAVYMMDIDNFKDYNDTYGHVAGDECLKMIGETLIQYSKTRNIKFYRYGGEEILAILFDKNLDADKVADELIKLISSLGIKTSTTKYGVVTTSIGYQTENVELIQRINMADEALYEAKNSGKNRACKY